MFYESITEAMQFFGLYEDFQGGVLMTILDLLPDLVTTFYQSGPLGDELAFSAEGQKLGSALVWGQLGQFYRHLIFSDACYFGNRFFNLALLALKAENRDPAYLGLDSLESWRERPYEIFAQTMAEDILFCAVDDPACPVYGLISGDDRMIKLSDSLAEFLSFYMALTRLQAITFKREIYVNGQLDYKKEFIAEVVQLIEDSVSGQAQAGLMDFILDGATLS